MEKQPDTTVEARLRHHLEIEAELLAKDPIPSLFYLWQKNGLRPVTVEPKAGIRGVQHLIEKAEQIYHFEPKRCYDNASELTISSLGRQEINYIEGYIVLNKHMLFGHAWNSISGRYFDHTMDLMNTLLTERGVAHPSVDYFKMIELPPQDLYPYTIIDVETSIQFLLFLKQYGFPQSSLKDGRNLIADGTYLP